MTIEDAGKPFNHTAKLSAASLRSQYPEPGTIPEDASWVIVRENGVYVLPGTPPALFFSGEPGKKSPAIQRVQYLGYRDDGACYAAEISSDPAIPGCTFYPNIRELYGVLPDDELATAALAVRIIDFDRTTRFCGQCGAPTRQSLQERAKYCDTCGRVTYPRTSPAIIVLVQNDDKILLARSPRFPPDLYSILAGFVEPGENLEEAIHREVREETGIEVANIRYMGSEPWPFPDSLMIGFLADYAGGDIAIDNNEIISAGWFDRDHLPTLPSTMSISRALIDWWAGDTGPQQE
ncbi:MAG: NAD(+) diphosphatase [Methanoregula sp.]|nr:NAD(+) diphosphatase [Methanoregula sp.]